MVTITHAQIRRGFTSVDHLITLADQERVQALIGKPFRDHAEAEAAANAVFVEHCDPRARLARVEVLTAPL